MQKLALLVILSIALFWRTTAPTFADSSYPYIIGQIPIKGFVTQLVMAPFEPVLYAIVSPDGQPKSTDRYGLYIFNISDPLHPREINYYKLTNPRQLALAGEYVFALNDCFYQNGEKSDCGILILKVSDLEEVARVGRIPADTFKMHLSQPGGLLFFEERTINPTNKKGLQVYDVGKPWNVNPLTILQLPASVFGLTTSPDGKTLIVRDMIDNVLAFDLGLPAAPKQIFKQPFKPFGSEMTAKGGRIYTNDSRRLGIYEISDKIEEVGSFGPNDSIRAPFVFDDEQTALLVSSKTIRRIDISNPSMPRESAKYPFPDYIGSVVAIKAKGKPLYLAGLLGSLAVIDPFQIGVTADSLLKAHERALQLYNATVDPIARYGKSQGAAEILEAAGINAAVKKKPQELTDKQYAYILNDYAFFLMQDPGRLGDAIDVLRVVIRADPKRVVAYLNLGDALRVHMSEAKNYKDKVAATKEIKRAYTQYKKLSGKSNETIESFLHFNLVDAPQLSICEHIAAYVNAGRFNELLGDGSGLYGDSTIVDLNGDGKTERVQITYEGTAHYPYMQVFDVKLGTAVEISEPDKDFNGPWADSIGLVPFNGQTYVLHYSMGGYPVLLTAFNENFQEQIICRFANEPIETVGEGSEDKKLCAVILKEGHPSYLPFMEEHSVNPQANELIEASTEKAGMVDVDNDGKEEPIVAIQYASGAGAGCDYNYFALLNSDRTSLAPGRVRDLLVQMQGLEQEHFRHPVPSCRGNVTGWFRLSGITYYETKFRGDDPSSLLSAFHDVSYIKDDGVHKVCEFVFAPRTRVQ
jgi:tetratricopeptide (TPR) repeat protein